jgi:hypothetical protein
MVIAMLGITHWLLPAQDLAGHPQWLAQLCALFATGLVSAAFIAWHLVFELGLVPDFRSPLSVTSLIGCALLGVGCYAGMRLTWHHLTAHELVASAELFKGYLAQLTIRYILAGLGILALVLGNRTQSKFREDLYFRCALAASLVAAATLLPYVA